MNVLFVFSLGITVSKNGLLDFQECMQFGISHISSFLKKQGHRTDLVVLSRLLGRKNKAILDSSIDQFKPDLICFTAVSTEYSLMADMAAHVKKSHPDIFLLIGGVHVTLNPEDVANSDFDALCIGEGEQPTLELIEKLERSQPLTGIPNIWFKKGREFEKNPPREFLRELDLLPFPDRDMWQKWMKDKDPERCSVLLSRGCSFSCSYCSNHALKGIARGTYVRYRSPENICAEIKELLIRFPKLKEIYLENETITSNRDWCLKLCLALEGLNATLKRPLSFGANFRIIPGQEMDSIFSALKKANFRFVQMGLESGSEKLRREVLRRNYSNDDVIHVVGSARKQGLQVGLFNLIGIPGETFSDFKETVRMNRLCRPDWNYAYIFYPYPGTDLHLLCKKQGLLPKMLDPRNERYKARLDLPGFPRKKIQESLRYFDCYVYDGVDPEDRWRSSLFKWKRVLIDYWYGVDRGILRTPVLRNVRSLARKLYRAWIRKNHKTSACPRRS